MPIYKLIVSYDGTRFHGFQRQVRNEQVSSMDLARYKKRPRYDAVTGQKQGENFTVQECMEMAISHFSESPIDTLNFRFAGRTDKGVHARGQVVSVQISDNAAKDHSLHEILKGINSRLPNDISVANIQTCTQDFHPRHDAKMKQYSYTIKYRQKIFQENTEKLLPLCESGYHTFRDAHDPPCMWLCPWSLDDSLLDKVLDNLKGTHNYDVFVHKEERDIRSNIMTIDRIWFKEIFNSGEAVPSKTIRLFFESEGFRRTMVRNLVGFIVDYCRGKDEVLQLSFDDIWGGNKEAAKAIHAAPASGLCLECVKYD